MHEDQYVLSEAQERQHALCTNILRAAVRRWLLRSIQQRQRGNGTSKGDAHY